MSEPSIQPSQVLRPTVSIVAAYVGKNTLQVQELAPLIDNVSRMLQHLAQPPAIAAPEPQRPAVAISKSIKPDYLICLMDGKRFRSLKRHLKSRYGMTPDEYRTRWGLPSDYPMVAPGYARERSELAKAMGLGQLRRRKPV